MRQAGEQLYYSSGMAGSAEGEALTPILMRLRSAVTKHMQEDQAEKITQLPESILPHGKPSSVHHSENKSDLLSSHSSSIFSTFEPFWQIYCTLSIHNNPAPTTTTHRSCYRRNNNHCWSFSSSICCRLSTDLLAFNYKLLKWNESTTECLFLLENLKSTFDRDKEIHQYFIKLFTQHVCTLENPQQRDRKT